MNSKAAGGPERPPFEYIEHPAEEGIRVYGHDLAALFAHAALGLCSLITDTGTVLDREARPVQVTALDRESLLVAWLSEVLWLIEAEDLLFSRFTIVSISETALSALAHGEAADPNRHPYRSAIKAVTYHQLAVRQRDGMWSTNLIFDV
ncbi:MAG: protein archease [Dehalococcoidia bacterium]|nr:protein archease [Dehalococcoidia bacterium]